MSAGDAISDMDDESFRGSCSRMISAARWYNDNKGEWLLLYEVTNCRT